VSTNQLTDHRAVSDARCVRPQGGRGKLRADKSGQWLGVENRYFLGDVLYGHTCVEV